MKKPAIFFSLAIISMALIYDVTHTTSSQVIPDITEFEQWPGGNTTVSIKPSPSLMLPASNLATEKRPTFHAGKALAHQPWVIAPSSTNARDGLGPLYNSRT